MPTQRTDWRGHGLRVTHTVTDFERVDDPTPRRFETDDGAVRLHFALRGDYTVRYPEIGRAFELTGGHHNVLYAEHFDFEFVHKTPSLETFGVQFPVSQFVAYADGVSPELSQFCERLAAGKQSILFDRWPPITPAIEDTIRQIRESRYAGPMEEIFVLSKGIELLVQAVEAASLVAPGQYLKTSSDRDRVIAARDVVNDRLTAPPSLSEVARLVGLNEYKLKRGFKEMFGTTVFAYLTEQRLDLAKRSLRDTQKTAAEIAFELGYATPQHFHSAFKKRFGVTPNSMRKAP